MLNKYSFFLLIVFSALLSSCTEESTKSQKPIPASVPDKPASKPVFSKWIVKEEKDRMTDELRVMIMLNSTNQNSLLSFFCDGNQAMFNWKVSASPRESYGGGLMDDMKISVDVRFDDGQISNEKWVFKLKYGVVVPPKSFFDNALKHEKVALKGFFITQDLLSVFEISGLEKDYSKYRNKCKITNDAEY